VAHIAGIEFLIKLDFHEINTQETEIYLKGLTSKYSNIIYGQQTEILVRLEEGSLKVSLAILGALYIGIGQYGSFRSGIDYMIKDAKSLKELVTNELVKNGLNEADIIESKRIHCDPDKIRRVLLSIERYESYKNISREDVKKELSKIRTSVKNICVVLSDEDAGLFASSIKTKYLPEDPRFPHFIERYRLLAREEDIVHYPVASIEKPRVNKALQRTIR